MSDVELLLLLWVVGLLTGATILGSQIALAAIRG